jgi:hypothetical protein
MQVQPGKTLSLGGYEKVIKKLLLIGVISLRSEERRVGKEC